MTFTKPRGSTHGIKRYQSDVRERTRSTLQQTLKTLALECPNSLWSNIQICRKAGLASSVALKKPWNADITALIQSHNAKIREMLLHEKFSKKTDTQTSTAAAKHPTSKLIKKLRSELAIRDAELFELEKENRALRAQLHRAINNHMIKK